MPDLAQWYAKKRGSSAFVLLLCSFVAAWLALHWAFDFDHAFGALNLFLSFEASVSLAFFTMMSDRQTASAAAQSAALVQAIDEIRGMSKVLVALAEAEASAMRKGHEAGSTDR